MTAQDSSAHDRSVVVTGAAGFIGSHVCQALLQQGIAVHGVDNFDPFYSAKVKQESLREIRETSNNVGTSFEFHENDICDQSAMAGLFERVRPGSVIHLAAKAGVRPSIADPVGYARTNLLGTQVVLDAANRVECEKVVVASSSSVYGNNKKTPFSEDDPVERCVPGGEGSRCDDLLPLATE